MAHLLLASRDLGSDINSAKHTFTTWDGCMSKAYCKWPVIIGIILGSLILLSILTCIVRCLCCGAECCCACFSCCNRCCPSPRRRNDQPYYPPPQPYYGQPPYGQYQPHPQPVYGAGALAPPGAGLRGAPVAQTAMFETSSRPKFNEDALPPMPSWDTAKSHHIEEEVEMEKLNPPSTPHERLLPHDDGMRYQNPDPPEDHHAGDLGAMSGHQSLYNDHNQNYGQAAGAIPPRGPQHSYDEYRQVASPVSTSGVSSGYPPTYHTTNPYNDYPQSQSSYADSGRQPYANNYEPPRQNWSRPQPNNFSAPFQAPQQQQQQQAPQQQSGYHAYSHNDYQQSSPQPQYQSYGASPPPNQYSSPTQSTPFVGRRPVQGSWREV